MKVTEETIIEALRGVIDIEIGLDIVSLGLIYGVNVNDENDVVVDMTLTVPTCPMAGMMTEQARAAVAAVDGVKEAKINLTFDPPWTPDRMNADIKKLFGH